MKSREKIDSKQIGGQGTIVNTRIYNLIDHDQKIEALTLIKTTQALIKSSSLIQIEKGQKSIVIATAGGDGTFMYLA